MPVCGSGVLVCSCVSPDPRQSCRRQAETPLIALFRFSGPALSRQSSNRLLERCTGFNREDTSALCAQNSPYRHPYPSLSILNKIVRFLFPIR